MPRRAGRPQFAGNVGSAARVMRNMGLSDLVLVAPEADIDDRQARQLSTHGEEILDCSRTVAELGRPSGIASSSRRRRPAREAVPPPVGRVAGGRRGLLVEALPAGPVALVFGPERTGLTDDEVTRCHHLIHIRRRKIIPP